MVRLRDDFFGGGDGVGEVEVEKGRFEDGRYM